MKFNKILAFVVILTVCCSCTGKTNIQENELESISYKAYEKDLNLSNSGHWNNVSELPQTFTVCGSSLYK